MDTKSNEEKIKDNINTLINHLRKNADENIREQVLSFARKVFGGAPGKPINDSPAEIKEKVTTRVAQLCDQRSVLSSQDLTQRFLSNNTAYRKQQILRMLLKLSQLNQQDSGMINIFRQPCKKDLNATIQTNTSTFLNNHPQPLGITQLQGVRRQGLLSTDHIKIARNRGSADESVKESDLVRQLLFVFGNTTSTDIIEIRDSYEVRLSLQVSQPVKKMVNELAQLGWLHRRIINQSQKPGTVGKALNLAITQELNEYYRWIGSMQTLAKSGRLTLRKLVYWSYQPELIMRHLAIILQEIGLFQGVHLISIVNSFRPSGLAPIQSLLDRLLGFLIQPLLNYIYNWVYLGQLLDSRGQFFIAQNKKVSQSEEWTQRFKLVPENIPNVLDVESAKKIFNAGKTIFFLRNRCKVIYNVQAKFPQSKNGSTVLGEVLGSWLQEAHAQVGAQLVDVLRRQFHLKYHLQSMKHFFLCGKGDFIQHIFDSLRDELSQKKQAITEISLDGYINDAIEKCFTDYMLPDKQSYRSGVLNRLLAKKIDYGSGVQGWGVFNFQYSLQRLQPMQALLSPQIMMNYQKIFFFLWKVKQIQQSLKTIWKLHSKDETIRMRRARSRQIQKLFHFCYLLRNSMSHFLSNLHSYLMISMQSSWDKFWQSLDKVPTFDEVLKIHREFQQQILEITLNTPKYKQIANALNNIFAVITNFKIFSHRFQQKFDQYYEKYRMYEDRRGLAKKGFVSNQSFEVPQFYELNSLYKDVHQIGSCFETAFTIFFNQVRKDGQSKLSILSFKLDYSEYYSTKINE